MGATRLLLKAKATVDLRVGEHGSFALSCACEKGNLECAQMLLEAKAVVDQANTEGARHWASPASTATWSARSCS